MWKWCFVAKVPSQSCSCAFLVLIYIPTYSFIFNFLNYYSFNYSHIEKLELFNKVVTKTTLAFTMTSKLGFEVIYNVNT